MANTYNKEIEAYNKKNAKLIEQEEELIKKYQNTKKTKKISKSSSNIENSESGSVKERKRGGSVKSKANDHKGRAKSKPEIKDDAKLKKKK